MSKIKIEKGIPVPIYKTKQRGQVVTTFIFEMEEGDSIVLPHKKASSLRGYIGKNFKEWKAVWRKLPDGNYRVWKMKRDNDA